MRFRLPAVAALAFAFFACGTLACSKDSDKTSIKDIGDADTKPHKFEPDPLGTIPPMDTSEPPPVAVAPTVTASGSPSAASSAASPKSSAAVAASGTPSVSAAVKLLAPGEAPRKKLRYKFKVGQTEIATMDMQTGYAVEAGPDSEPEKKLPMVRFKIVIEPKSVSPEGDLKYEYRLVSADVVENPQVPPQLAGALKQMMAGLKGLSGTGVVSARGINKESTFSAPQGASPQTEQMIEQIRQTTRDLAAPLPEEEVGKGAKWEKITKVENAGQKAAQKETYTLVDLTGDTGKIDVVVLQNAPGGAVQAPGIPAGAGIRIENMVSNGKGTTAFDLNRITPTSALDAVTTMLLLADRGGQTEKAKMTMKVTLRLSGGTK